MKKTNLLLAGLFAALVCGCSDDLQEAGSVKLSDYALKATIGGNQARTSVDASNNVLWSENDAIGVYTSDGKMLKYDIASGVDQVSATFEPADAENTPAEGATIEFAVYPYEYNGVQTTLDKYNRINMTFPSEIDYTECSNGPMYAAVNTEAESISFEHIAALLKIPVQSIPTNVTQIKVQMTNIAGDFQGEISELPILKHVQKTTTENVLTIKLQSQSIASPCLYIPIAENTYNGITVGFYDGQDKLLGERSCSDEIVIENGKIYSMADLNIALNVEVATSDAFYEELSKGTEAITVTAPIELSKEIDLLSTSRVTFEQAPTISEGVKFTKVTNCSLTSFTLTYPYSAVTDQNATTTFLSFDLENINLVLKALDETPDCNTQLEEKAIANWETENQKQDLVVSGVQAMIYNAQSITLYKNTCIDKMTICKGASVNKISSNTGTYLLQLHIQSGASVTNYDNAVNGDAYAIENPVVDENTSSFVLGRSAASAAASNASVWDGSVTKPTQLSDGTYIISSADRLAWFCSQEPPKESMAANLPVTISANVRLTRDIDLAEGSWMGMVIKDATFDGNGKTIYNLNMSQYILDQQGTIYSPEACVGLFAAVYGNSTIKNLTLDGVEILPSSATSPKWVGSLVGYSLGTGTVYDHCIAKNVNIFTHGWYSYRVGGLIGYIEKSQGTTEATATLIGCEVQNASIAASYSYGGLVGSLFDSVTFDDCHTSNITLSLNKENRDYYGYVSGFIGDVTNSRSHNRIITIKDCSADGIDTTELGFENVAAEQGKTGTYVGGSEFVGVVDYPEQITIKVINGTDEKVLENGVDFNKYVNQ